MQRIQEAWNYRAQMGYTGCCRVVFGEADLLPGLVVDKFNDVLSVQFLTLGMERWKEVVIEVLNRWCSPRGSTSATMCRSARRKVWSSRKATVGAAFNTDLVIDENGLKVHVDVADGQKTGHFLDQVQNHAAMQRISKGKRVLDCFTHTGGFALHAALYGADGCGGLGHQR